MFRLLFFVVFLTSTVKSCPKGSVIWQNSCYTFMSEVTGFADAENECIQKGGHLTSIHDGFTNAWISQEASKYFHESTVINFWIGLTDLINPGNWSWTDGTLMNFNETSFNKTLNGLDCISVTMANGQWQADDCFKAKPYVCKLTPICPQPFLYFQPTHSCYGDPSERQFKNWTMSENYCILKGGHLASIHSPDEIAFLRSLIFFSATNFWVGAYSNDGGLTWKWSDNTSWDFKPWAPGYPRYKTSECGTEYGDGLVDTKCNEGRTLVCQIKL
jgi:hypothetical protein